MEGKKKNRRNVCAVDMFYFLRIKVFSNFSVNISPNYNISPNQNILVIDENLAPKIMNWGSKPEDENQLLMLEMRQFLIKRFFLI